MPSRSPRWLWLLFALGPECVQFNPGDPIGTSGTSTITEDCLDGQADCPCLSDDSCPVGLQCVLGQCQDPTASTLGSTGANTTGIIPNGTGTTGTGTSSSSSTSSSDEETGDSSSSASTETTDHTESSDAEPSCAPPHSTQCYDSTHIQTCTAEGNWGPPQVCVNQACVGNTCTGECAPKSSTCVDAKHMRSCSDTGLWGSPMACQHQTCVGNACTGECGQDERRCQGQEAQSCNMAGLWETQSPCNGPNEACKDGECFKTCEPWVRQFGTSENDYGKGIAMDGSGNAFITGDTRGDLGGTNAGESDIFISKYSPNGSKQWTKQFGTNERDYGNGIAVDGSGNITITGSTLGAFDGQAFAGGQEDIFIAKYSPNGKKLWTQRLGTSLRDIGRGIAVDGSGNAFITGYADGKLDDNIFAGNRDIFIAKYSPNGKKLWTRQLGTDEHDSGCGIAVDGSGNAYITGYPDGSLDGHNSAGDHDIFVAKYSPNGSEQWTQQFGAIESDAGFGIAVDGSGNLTITGYTDGALDGQASAGFSDIFTAKYSPNGSKQWTQQFGTNQPDYGSGIAVDGSGNAYITGTTWGIFDGNTDARDRDIFVAKYSPSGKKLWTQQLGTSGEDYGEGIAVDGSGNPIITGTTDGVLGGNTSAGRSDIFIAKVCKDKP